MPRPIICAWGKSNARLAFQSISRNVWNSNVDVSVDMPLISISSVCSSHDAPPLLSCQPVTRRVRGVSPRAWGETEGRSRGSSRWGSSGSKEEMRSCCVLELFINTKPPFTWMCFSNKMLLTCIQMYWSVFFSSVSLIVDSILPPDFSLPPPLSLFFSLPPTTFFRPVSHFHLLLLSHPLPYPSLLTISG